MKKKLINTDRIVKIFQFFLVCIYILGSALNDFNRKPSILECVIATTLIVVLTTSLYIVFRSKFKNNNAAWILTIVFTLLTYSYSEIMLELADWNEILVNVLYFLLYIVLYYMALLFISKPLFRANQLLSAATILYGILGFYYFNLRFKTFAKYENRETKKISYVDSINKPPNIYLFLLDAYSGQESLKKNLNFDNAAFIDSLKQKGFYYFENSRSNYNSTLYSVTSFFIQDTLPSNLLQTSSTKQNRLRIGKMEDILANGNILATKLENKGYKFYNLSPFNINHHPPRYPRLFFKDWNSFWLKSLYQTFYGKFLEYLSNKRWIKNFTFKPEFVERQIFNDLDSIVSAPSTFPKFVYLHSLAIHSPFHAVNENNFKTGFFECLFDDPKVNRETKYTFALESLNRRVIKSINTILAKDKKSKIFVFSDHGARILNDSTLYYNFMSFYDGNSNHDNLKDISTPTDFSRAINFYGIKNDNAE